MPMSMVGSFLRETARKSKRAKTNGVKIMQEEVILVKPCKHDTQGECIHPEGDCLGEECAILSETQCWSCCAPHCNNGKEYDRICPSAGTQNCPVEVNGGGLCLRLKAGLDCIVL